MEPILNDSSTHPLKSIWALMVEILTLRERMRYLKCCLWFSKKDLHINETELPVSIKNWDSTTPILPGTIGMTADRIFTLAIISSCIDIISPMSISIDISGV